jgi:integrase
LFGETMNGFNGWAASKRKLDARILDARRKAAARAHKPVEQVKPIAPWRLHDVRRSAATHMAELGVLPHIVEAVLNHTGGHKAGVAGVYNHARYEREVKAALALWADYVFSLVNSLEPKVVPLRRN